KMLEKDKIIPTSSISKGDKIKITGTANYLAEMNYARKIDWLPDDLSSNNKFEKTFGFEKEYENQDIGDMGRYINLSYEEDFNLSLEGYQHLIRLHLYPSDSDLSNEKEFHFEVDGLEYTLVQQFKDNGYTLELRDNQNKEKINVDMQPIFETMLTDENIKKEGLSVDEATIVEENDQVEMKIIVETLNEYDNQYNGDFYLFVRLK
ncbi:MAG: hypothetical protein RR439_07195, partial [Carnobacterium sp.]